MDEATRKLYEMKAEVLAGLAHPVRLAVAEYLREGEQCVCDIASAVDSERSNVSRHLAVMVRAGILEHRKDGLRMLYRLRTPCVLNFLECVTTVLRDRATRTREILGSIA